MTLFIEDGVTPVWQDHKNYEPLEYKHLERDKFEELLDMMIEAYPEHELTHWLKRGFCMNEGDSTLAILSLIHIPSPPDSSATRKQATA